MPVPVWPGEKTTSVAGTDETSPNKHKTMGRGTALRRGMGGGALTGRRDVTTEIWISMMGGNDRQVPPQWERCEHRVDGFPCEQADRLL